jgi:hypothetical protein
MPKMIIRQLSKYKKEFSIKPDRKLQKDFNDWDRRIHTEIEGFVKLKDYGLKLKQLKHNNIKIYFDGKKNFKLKRLLVDV